MRSLNKLFSFFIIPFIFCGKICLSANAIGTVQECYSETCRAFQDERWKDLLQYSTLIIKKYPSSSFSSEAYYYQGVAYFHLNDYENSAFSFAKYLTKEISPKFFQEVLAYKFEIAEKFRQGEKRRLFGLDSMPKWIPARDEAVAMYDEVIHSLPRHDLAAKALFSKASIQFYDEEYPECVETLQQLIKEFDKHELAIEAFLLTQKAYQKQVSPKRQDSNLLDLAELNLKKFRATFPNEERIAIAEEIIKEMQEVYAKGLYEIGRFYERTHKPKASVVYYLEIINSYPQTQSAKLSEKRMEVLKKNKVV